MKKIIAALLLTLPAMLPLPRHASADVVSVFLGMGAVSTVLLGSEYIEGLKRRANQAPRVPATGYLNPPPVGFAATPGWSYPPGYTARGYDPRHGAPAAFSPTVVYSSIQPTRAGAPVYRMHPRDRALMQDALRRSEEARQQARAAHRNISPSLTEYLFSADKFQD